MKRKKEIKFHFCTSSGQGASSSYPLSFSLRAHPPTDVENDSIIVTMLGQLNKITTSFRRLFAVELDSDGTVAGVELNSHCSREREEGEEGEEKEGRRRRSGAAEREGRANEV